MYNRIARGVKGFTLIELLAVMAIVGVLAGIVSVSVAGSGETSRDTQTVQDGTTIETSVADFFGAQTGGAVEERKFGGNILDFTVETTGAEVKSSVWPENFLTDTYSTEFPDNDTTVKSVTLTDEDGTTTIAVVDFLPDYTAIDFTTLDDGGFLTFLPDSAESVSTTSLKVSSTDTDFEFHNFLWLLRKDTASGSTGSVSSRGVVIYKLLTVAVDPNNTDSSTTGTVALTYLRIF